MPSTPEQRATERNFGPILALSATFIAYAAVSLFGFVYDDEAIVRGTFAKQWALLPQYFAHNVWYWVYPNAHGNYYRPVFLSWLLLNFKLFALHAAAWHLALLGLHLLVTWQVYRVSVRLVRNDAAACVTALIFGLHPVHIEAVAWISGATEPLVAVFILAALLAYMAFRVGESRRGLLLAHLWFALALLAKETGVLVPVLLFAYDMIVRSDEERDFVARATASLRRLWPMAAIFGAYLIARYAALGALSYPMSNMTPAEVLLTIPAVLIFYARLLFYPVRLSAFYDLPYVTRLGAAVAPLIAFCVIAGAIVYLVWRSRSRTAMFALAMLVLPLLPLMKLDVFIENDFAHDRYLYLPSIGFALLLGLVFDSRAQGRLRKATIAACAVLVIGYAGATLMQSLNWASNITLYARGIAIAPDNPIVRSNFANEFLKRGATARAEEEYRSVLRMNPNFWLARFGLGYSEYIAGDCAAATRDLEIAARQNPDNGQSVFYLGMCRLRQGDRENGIAMMRRGIELAPVVPELHAELADVLAAGGNPNDLRAAVDLYRTEAQVNPDHPYAARQAAEIASKLNR